MQGNSPKKKHSPGGIDKQFFLAVQNLRAGIFGVPRIHLLISLAFILFAIYFISPILRLALKGVHMKFINALFGLWNVVLMVCSLYCIIKASNFANKELYPQACYYIILAVLFGIYYIGNSIHDKLDTIKSNASVKE